MEFILIPECPQGDPSRSAPGMDVRIREVWDTVKKALVKAEEASKVQSDRKQAPQNPLGGGLGVPLNQVLAPETTV